MPQRRGSLKTPKVGEWAFIIGVLLAVVFGLVPSNARVLDPSTVSTVLVVLGIVVGLLNIQKRESSGFLLATLVLMVAKTAGLETLPFAGAFLGAVFANLALLVAPAAVIVALKAVFSLAKN